MRWARNTGGRGARRNSARKRRTERLRHVEQPGGHDLQLYLSIHVLSLAFGTVRGIACATHAEPEASRGAGIISATSGAGQRKDSAHRGPVGGGSMTMCGDDRCEMSD